MQDIDWVVATIARHYCMTRKKMLSRDRHSLTVRARWALFLTLNRMGWRTCDIASLCEMDHSTVLHGLTKGREDPDITALAEHVAPTGLAGVNLQPLAPIPAWDRGDIISYLEALTTYKTLRFWQFRGLRILAKYPYRRQMAYQCLAQSGLEHFKWSIRDHARQAGLRWAPDVC